MENKIIAITANTCWYILNFRKNTIVRLINEGYTVIACAPEDDYLHSLVELGCIYKKINIDKSGLNPLKDLKTIYEFYAAFKKFKVNAVLNFTPKNNIYSTMAAKLAGAKVINNIAGLGTAFSNSGFLNFIVRTLYKFSQKNADYIFFQNKDDADIFKNLGIVSTRTDILPGSGVDLNRFAFTPAINDGVTRFALIARLLRDKGITQYAESARALKAKYGDGVEFLLVGFVDDINPRSISSAEIDKWVGDGYVQYLGISNSIEQIVGGVDCVVLPSFYREGVPKSLLEAAAMGKPIVTTDNVGCRETVEDGVTGLLCQTRSVKDLCEKLDLIINMPFEQRLMMGRAGRDRVVKLFDEKIVIDKYLRALAIISN